MGAPVAEGEGPEAVDEGAEEGADGGMMADGWVMDDGGAGGVPSSRRGPGTNPTVVATTNDTRALTCCLDGRVLRNAADLKMDMAASHFLIVAANR
ncbi:hypothetical protein [Arthrobacter sp. D1-17]